jgi:phage regulator Rha-like protein
MIGQSLTGQSLNAVSNYGGMIHQSLTDESRFFGLTDYYRFSENFCSQLNEKEYAFTEHGVVMLSSVLRSRKAAQVRIALVNAFIKMREYLASHGQILEKLRNRLA